MVAEHLKKSLVLVGLMGSGKTSVGRRLAARLGAPFCDCDEEIVAAAGQNIPGIFAEFGETYFRDGETKVLRRLLEGPPQVIATGGGAFVREENRDLIRAHGISIWFSASVEVLWDRVKGKPGRPLLDVPNPQERLAELAQERAPFYKLANIEVESRANEPHEAVVDRVLKALAKCEGQAATADIRGGDDEHS